MDGLWCYIFSPAQFFLIYEYMVVAIEEVWCHTQCVCVRECVVAVSGEEFILKVQ